jgi:DNA-binding MarR family transcriptional regulator
MTKPTEQQVARFSRFIKDLTRRYFMAEVDLTGVGADLSKSELHIIELIAWHDCRNVSQVARAGQMPLSSASWLIDRLVERGFLARERSRKDRRVVELSLTSQGEQVVSRLDRAFEEMAYDLLAVASEEEREALLAIAERIEFE